MQSWRRSKRLSVWARIRICRYVVWNITVPLPMIEFNLILKAAQRPVTSTASGDLLRRRGDARIRICRYVVWNITVPLLMIEFNLILKAAQRPVTSDCFRRLFLSTVMMLAFGYAGEPDPLEAWIGFFRHVQFGVHSFS